MGNGLSVLSSSLLVDADDLPVTDPDKCQHKFCEKWGPGHYHCADCHSTIQDETLIVSEDAIIDSIVDESVAEDGVYRGVSIQFLVDFATTCKCWDMTTRDVRRRFVMPATRANRCRFVELPEMQQSPQRYVGRAGTFVSHTWGAKFGDLVAALCDGGADRSRYVWVDIFAVRQWPSRKPDLDFSAVVRQCGSFVVVCSSLPEVADVEDSDMIFNRPDFSTHVRNQLAFQRVWCLVEIHSAIRSGAAIVLKCGNCLREESSIDFETNRSMLMTLSFMVDIESADATVASDKERILNEIRASEGGVDAVNRAVRGAITGSMLSDPLVQCAACDDQRAIDEILKDPSEHVASSAGCGFTQLLQMLIDGGADVNHIPVDGVIDCTAVEAAAVGGHAGCVSLLLRNNCIMKDKTDLLSSAAFYGHTTVVGLLLDHGCDVNQLHGGGTPLMAASAQGHTECAKLLIERGADIDVVCKGMSAVYVTAMASQAETLQLLVDSGASPLVQENSIAIVMAARIGSLKCLEILIQGGWDLETVHDDSTALMVAAQSGHAACLQCLIDAGANKDVTDDDGRTPLWNAEFMEQWECVKLLQQ